MAVVDAENDSGEFSDDGSRLCKFKRLNHMMTTEIIDGFHIHNARRQFMRS